jgi:hypothetical protein
MTMRARDHKTLEALRIGAVRSVEVDESPSVARALGVTVRTMSASLFAGPHPRHVGGEALESGHRRPHGGDQQRRFREEGSQRNAWSAK